MAQHPDLRPVLQAALTFWQVDASITTCAHGVVINCGSRVIEVHADAEVASGWWLHIGAMPRLRAASVGTVLREIRLQLDPTFIPGQAIVGARAARA
jgi:hypothetical protein